MSHVFFRLVRRSGFGAAVFLSAAVFAAAIATPAAANSKYAGMVVDHLTGKVLYASSADAPRYPASLTKIMTLYLLFDEIEAGRIRLSDSITMSKQAASMPPSKLGIKPGGKIKVEDAILALVTKSANDVAAAIAEHVAGTESAFAKRMTRKARALGMRRTTFRNASGLPDSEQKTTARDMITLSRAIMTNHPRGYRYFKTRSFSYRGNSYRNHNRLLGSVSGVDGIKTGYTRASGFNLTSSVRRDNKHIVAVVMGGRTGRSRNEHMASLISRYMPAAIASKQSPDVPPGVLVAAADIPLPLRRPRLTADGPLADDDPIATTLRITAVVEPDEAETVVAAAPAPNIVRSVATTNVVMASTSGLPGAIAPAAARTPVPQEAIGEGDQTEADEIVPQITGGWAIQIGAVHTKPEAETLLGRASTMVPGATASRTPFTEETVKNGTTYIRARFAGYETPDEAKAACAAMKKKGFGCYPISL